MKVTKNEIEGRNIPPPPPPPPPPLDLFTQGIPSKEPLEKYTRTLRQVPCSFLEEMLEDEFEERVAGHAHQEGSGMDARPDTQRVPEIAGGQRCFPGVIPTT